MTYSRADWANSKRDTALRLAAGECGGSYGEAVIILCAVINAIAADVWPGTGKDRKRFVEALKEFAPSHLGVVRISVPLLIGRLRKNAQLFEMAQLKNAFLNCCPSLVLTGDDVDKSEAEIVRLCPTLRAEDVRSCSYASLLYEEVRSGYAHEYSPGSRADSWPMSSVRGVPVSYVNRLRDPDRRIHFHIGWVAAVAVAVAAGVDASGAAATRPDPLRWWLQG